MTLSVTRQGEEEEDTQQGHCQEQNSLHHCTYCKHLIPQLNHKEKLTRVSGICIHFRTNFCQEKLYTWMPLKESLQELQTCAVRSMPLRLFQNPSKHAPRNKSENLKRNGTNT